MAIRISNYVPTKRATANLIKVKSCNALLRVLLVPIRSSLKLVLKYKYLNLNTYHLDTPYLREKECEEPWLFFESKSGTRTKKLGTTGLRHGPPNFIWQKATLVTAG
jgi:hypothetical protein